MAIKASDLSPPPLRNGTCALVAVRMISAGSTASCLVRTAEKLAVEKRGSSSRLNEASVFNFSKKRGLHHVLSRMFIMTIKRIWPTRLRR